MSVPKSVAEILDAHTTLEVECIDRMYLNLYVPILQREAGIVHFWRKHRGARFPSGARMGPMSAAFVRSIERFAEQQGVPLIRFQPGERKDVPAPRSHSPRCCTGSARSSRRPHLDPAPHRRMSRRELDASGNETPGQGV